MSNTEFLTVDNLKFLLSVMKDVMNKKFHYQLDTNSTEIKNIFLTIMNKIESDPANYTLNVTEKNKLTLKIVREIIKTQKIDSKKNVSLNRENEIHDTRTVKFQNNNPTFVSLNDNSDVSDKMAFVDNMRKLEEKIENPKWNEKGIEEKCESENKFKQQMKDLELSRTDFDNKLFDIFKNDSEKKQTYVEKRNEDMSVILNKNPAEIDPTAFFKQNNAINENNDSLNNVDYQKVPSSYKNLAMATIIDKEPIHEARIEKKYILINSYDRNWIVDKQRYKYKVKFSYSTNDILRVPYYENNPTVPFTKTEKSNGLPNEFGWVDKNGVFHNPYDPNQPLSSTLDIDGKPVELGFEEIEIIVDQDASMIGTFKDIYSISITNVCIPTEIFHNYVNTNIINSLQSNNVNNYNFNFNFPYILCNIDEFQDIYDGTDDTIRKAFCQLQYDNLVKTPNGRGYIILKPVQKEIKYFHPNPLSTLPTLNISLSKPNGELINTSEDGISIQTISVFQNYYLKITTKEFFDKDAFFNGDYIRIKNHNIYQINSLISRNNVTIFNNFINRKEGHAIYEIGEPNADGYFNSFHIFGMGEFNKSLGKFEVDNSIIDTISEFNNHLGNNNFFDSETFKDYENGYLLNMSLQNTISLTVEMFKPDSKIVKSESSRAVLT